MRSILVLSLFIAPAFAKDLQMYWIDVEGGAATLIVSPSGQSLLIDTGWEVDGRDAKRIVAAARDAGVTKIDHLIISHYHADHVGGLAALSKLIPILNFYGRGDQVEDVNKPWYNSFVGAAQGKRTIVKPGGKIPIAGLDALVVASDSKMLTKPVKGGGPNALCANAAEQTPAGIENQYMVGVRVAYGKFSFLALLDLDWEKEMELVCPVNMLGKITLYQTSRHGFLDGSGSPAMLGAIRPQVVVMNNGPRKGMGQVDNTVKISKPAPYEKNHYLRLAGTPGVEDIWQGHLSLLDPDPKHNTARDQIANFEETADCKGNWIKATVADGKLTMTNGRNGFTKSYQIR